MRFKHFLLIDFETGIFMYKQQANQNKGSLPFQLTVEPAHLEGVQVYEILDDAVQYRN